MIKAVGKNGEGHDVVFLGLSKENMARLLMDRPILVKLNELDPRLPHIDIAIIGGETEESIAKDLQQIPGRLK